MPHLWLAVALFFVSLFSPFQYATFRLHAARALPTSSSTDHAFTADRILAIAAEFMQQKEYYRAITEYKRFLFNFPQDHRRPGVHFRIGLAFYRGRDYGMALNVFREVAESYSELPHGQLARLWQGECLIRRGEFEAAENLYVIASLRSTGKKPQDHADYRRAWALLYQQEWQEATKRFRSLPVSNSFHETARRVAEALPYIQQSPRKSPLLAGVLSAVLPGSGQFYIGRPGDALLALMLNGLFVTGIVEALNQDRPAIAGMLGLFEAGWYAGSIYGAVNGAQKYNAYQARGFIQEMENQFPYEPPGPSLASPLFGVRLGLRF